MEEMTIDEVDELVEPLETLFELRTLAALTADIACALTRSNGLQDGLQACAEALVHGLDAAFARIWTLNRQENVLELQASAGLYTHLDGPHSRVPVGQLKIGLIAQERQPHLTNTVIGDPRVSDQEWAQREGLVAFAGYPLLIADRLVGVIALFAKQPLTHAALYALETVSDSIAYGIDRWQTIETLRASEERFALAVRGTDEGLWDWNIATHELFVAPRFKQLLGYEDHELESSFAMWESRLHPEDRERVVQVLQQHLEQQHLYKIDYRLRMKSGEYRWFHARGQALWGDNGRAVRMLGSISDIHQRKKTEELLKGLLETCPDPLVIVNQTGAITYVNLQTEKLFGYHRNELVGQPIEILVPENIRARHALLRDGYLAAPYLRPMTAVPSLQARHKTGKEIPVEISLSPLQTVDGLRVTCVIRDITERRAMEAALRESEERNRAVVANMGDALITLDERGLICGVNPAGARLFGYLYEELIGQEITRLMPERYRGEHNRGLNDYLRTGVSKILGTTAEVVGLRKDGTSFPADLTVSEYQLGGHHTFIGAIRDITERKQNEARLAALSQSRQILAESSNILDALPHIIQVLCEQLNWSVGEFWRRDRKAGVLHLAAFYSLPSVPVPNFEADSRGRTFALGSGLVGRTWASGRAEWMADVSKDSDFTRATAAAQDNLHGGVAFPILVHSEVIGVMKFIGGKVQTPSAADLAAVEDIAQHISRDIELQLEQRRTREQWQELEIAEKIQQQMVLKSMPVLEGFELAGATHATTQLGGDYFDLIPCPDGQMLLAVGDVSGHGLGPALVVASARACIRVLSLTDVSVSKIVEHTNARLAEDAEGEFMTLFLGLLNPVSRSLIYRNAGHCPGVILDARGEVRATLPSSDRPLGIESVLQPQGSTVAQLQPGDLLVLVSDGVFEVFNPDRSMMFGMPRVLGLIRAMRHLPAAAIIANLFSAVREFAQVEPPDDMTALVIKVAEER